MRFLLPLIVILCLFSTVNANILMDLWNKLDAWFEEKSQEACAEWNKHPEDSQDYGFGYGVIDKLQGCDQRDTEGNPLPGADLSFWGRFGAFVQAIAGIFRA